MHTVVQVETNLELPLPVAAQKLGPSKGVTMLPPQISRLHCHCRLPTDSSQTA